MDERKKERRNEIEGRSGAREEGLVRSGWEGVDVETVRGADLTLLVHLDRRL